MFSLPENNETLWRDLWPWPRREGNKYDRGHALIFGGPVLTGASRLAARAAQRIGAGLVTLAAPPEAWDVYARSLESVMVLKNDPGLIRDPKFDVVLIGPGLGLAPENRALILDVLKTGKPCVLDADALTLFKEEPKTLFKALNEKCVLTPHEGEFARLFGEIQGDKATRTKEAAQRAGGVVLLKGAETVIAEPGGRAVVNLNAPPWLATAGSGDVLAGMILGLMAAGMPSFEAACAAAHTHGVLAERLGPGLVAEDLVEEIRVLLKEKEPPGL